MTAEYICTVNATVTDARQAGNPAIGLVLTDTKGAFPETAFIAPDAVRREMLAQALAAISAGSTVLAVLDDPSANPPMCWLLKCPPG